MIRIGILAAVCLVLLRLAIGWHFFNEGLVKLEAKGSPTRGYLGQAEGPLAPALRWLAGDPAVQRNGYDFVVAPPPGLTDSFTVKPLPAGTPLDKVADLEKHLPPPVEKEWDSAFDAFVKHYKMEGEARKKAEDVFRKRKKDFVRWLVEGTRNVKRTNAELPKSTPQRLREYLDQIEKVKDVRSQELLTFGPKMTRKLRDAEALEDRMRDELTGDLKDQLEQAKSALREGLSYEERRMPQPPAAPEPPAAEWANLDTLDLVVKWGLLAIGACLLAGLLTRPAALGGFAFLLLVYLSFPPWPGVADNPRAEGNYLFVDKNLVEALALLALVFLPTGRWAGVDGLLAWLNPFRRSHRIHNGDLPMALDMTEAQKKTGRENFQRASGELSRRGFLKGLFAAGTVVPVAAAAYFGYKYEGEHKRPVRAALIGAGDEGGVLVGEHNPNYLEFVAVADIRPSNQKRIFDDEKVKNPNSPRRGLKFHYGSDAAKKIKVVSDYHDLLKDDTIEAVVIALPLHLHAPVAVECMKAGKHVLCEKLMAWNIGQCKKMIEAADQTGRILTVGHQRHYSLMYAQAVEAIRAGVLGDVKHIRALWHRNNTWPRLDKDGKPTGELRDSWRPSVPKEDKDALAAELQERWDYKNVEELVRWRLYARTGGGLMAELGSHQLDACSIFLGKVHPLAVQGVGGKMFYADDREVEDHVFVTFEFPGPDYFERDKDGKPSAKVKKKDDVVVVTYSSVNTNAFEAYGECIMGSRGTMVVEGEQNVQLYGEKDPNLRESGAPRSTSVTVTTTSGGTPALDASATTGGVAAAASADGPAGPVSKGYREEMEHFAYCVRMQEQASTPEEKRKWQLEPRCHGRVAMADAIIALTANLAMKNRQRIEFQEAWFDAASREVPDAEMKAKNHKGDVVEM